MSTVSRENVNVNRRTFLKSVAASAALYSGALLRCGGAPRRPNFLFIITDDMEKNMFNCLPEGEGKNLTPNIDRLASEGALLMHHYVASPVCTPARYNCLTGRFAGRAANESFLQSTKYFGQSVVQWNTFITPNDENTLPKILQRHGDRTGFTGKNHVMEVDGWVHLPFDADPNKPDIKEILKKNKELVQQGFHKMGWDFAESVYYRNPEMLGPEALSVHNQDWITKGGLDFLDTQDSEQPFFLYFATTIPHWPTEPKRSWNANPLATADGFLDQPLQVQPSRQSISRRIKEAGLEGTGRENILWLDDAVGALLKKLEEKGFLENTFIFFLSDHGQDAKGTLYQGGILNPMIIWKSGGLKCGAKSDVRNANIDFAPTMLDLAGVDFRQYDFDGVSFASLLNGDTAEIHDSLYFEMGFTRAVIKGKWKYLALRYPQFALDWTYEERKKILDEVNARRRKRKQIIINPDDPSKPFSHTMLIPGGGAAEHSSTGKLPGYYDADQLYDLENDPGEMKNLAGDPKYRAVLDEMKAELKKYLDDLPGGFPL